MSKPHKTYTATDIQRYHAGNMSAAERHALEKAALDDPFLADALEGYLHTNAPLEDVKKLQGRLTQREAKKRVALFDFMNQTWLRVAAVFVLVAGGGWLVYKLTFEQKKEVAIQQKATKQKILQAPDTVQENTATLSEPDTLQSPFTLTYSPLVKKTKAHRKQKKAVEPKVSTTQEYDVAASRPSDLSNEALDTVASTEVRQNTMAAPTAANHAFVKKESAMSRLFDSTTARAEGVTIARKNKDTINVNVVMKPSPDANKDLVVIGYGAKRNVQFKRKDTMQLLEPTEGWNSFNDYIAQNLQEPEDFREKTTSGGEVELQFEVSEKGEPVNIKVVRSLCTACDAEAIRLLKEGPKWKKENKKKGKVTIKF